MSRTAASAADLARQLETSGLDVLDEKPGSLPVKGDSDMVESASHAFEGRTAFPFARIPLPRPSIRKPLSKKP
jgi:hypothetical protein